MTEDHIRKGPTKMEPELRRLFEHMTPFQKKYAEYRAKGLKQSDAAEKAGSEASDRAALSRVGYNCEQVEGVREYIAYLCDQRAKASVIDSTEIADKLRRVYDDAMTAGKYADANKAAELLGNMIGAFKSVPSASISGKPKTKNNTQAFKEDIEDQAIDSDNKTDDRIKTLQKMMKEVNQLDKKPR